MGEENVACVEVGECHVSTTPLRVGMIDPSWAKGRLDLVESQGLYS